MSALDEKIKSYPVTFDIDYPEKQSRWKAFFRFLLVIPVALWLSSFKFYFFLVQLFNYFNVVSIVKKLTGLDYTHAIDLLHAHKLEPQMISTFVLVIFPVVLMILFRKKYPQWLFAFNVGAFGMMQRMLAYMFCMTTQYPSSDENQSVHLNITYPEVGKLNRFLPFVKWILIIPHIVCLLVLLIGALAVAIIAWVAILFTGKFPKGMFDFVVGVLRWSVRVSCYASLLTTDVYPPFSLK
jgi:hypothetical protein